MGGTYNLKSPPASGTIAEASKALNTYLPAVSQTTRNQLLPDALAQFGATAATAPGYGNLQADIFDTSGRKLAAIGDEIQTASANATQARDAGLLANSGGLLSMLKQAQQYIDPEYHSTRSTVADTLQRRLTQGLSGSEQTEIERGLNRQNQAAGTLNIPSQSTVTANALTYGKAGQDSLTQALQQANQFLTTAKTGTDVFQAVTGKASQPSPGLGAFQGTQQNNPSALGGNMFQSAVGAQTAANTANSAIPSQTMTIWGQGSQALSSY